ncbi:PD-(D/E)XK nuclease family protein [Ottowia caeni]|uniref:PD-(D/E)XK nuclease family protein n=1 Tax=Ottowia caeni TaxID=2870339 RepID=UPI003D7580E2|nr:PD-(D/E)XK nuclease family protein [Ottowia caeni]
MPLRPVNLPVTLLDTDPSVSPSPHLQTWQQLLGQAHQYLVDTAAHPARCVVLLPYAQLMPLAARLWAEQFPDGFAPRFETTRNWAARVGLFAPGPNDIALDHGRDLLTAASLLQGAGLGERRSLLCGPLVEQATQLAPLAASVPASLRPDWADQAREAVALVAGGPLALEAAVAHLAIAWAAASDYATDVLFEPRISNELDALVVIQGLQPDELVSSLVDHFSDRALLLTLQSEVSVPAAEARVNTGEQACNIMLHAARDGEDEAQRAAACVLEHIARGRVPVALTAGDRLLTRRITALLAVEGVRLRDETGWILSTTHAAACLMAALRACARHASTDTVVDWLKLAPLFSLHQARVLDALEAHLRRDAVRDWASAAGLQQHREFTSCVEALREPMQSSRRLTDWLAATKTLLEASGLWSVLAADAAGEAVVAALGLSEGAQAAWQAWPGAQSRMSLAEFTAWVGDVLEAASFRPPARDDAQVVILPMSQLLGRPFAALVLPGADEQRLPAAPEPPGAWSTAQRVALRLPTREELQSAQRQAWNIALQTPCVDVLWRGSDDSGEPLLASSLVRALRLQAGTTESPEPRRPREVVPQPVAPPQPRGDALPVMPLSASTYDMLRTCPYRFFALRQLGLRDESELDVDVDKRDFGNWVHMALSEFHKALKNDSGVDRVALLDKSAQEATQSLALEEGEFMPFGVGWAALRDGYLQWLSEYEATGAVFELSEESLEVTLGNLKLSGRVDRLDRLPNGAPLVIDYKTEPLKRTTDRLKAGNEDTQLPFYALLSGADEPRAAYLNVSEREGTSLHEPPELLMLAQQLYEGMQEDVARISAGDPLPALGEGAVCEWCEARGLCRKDFWSGE